MSLKLRWRPLVPKHHDNSLPFQLRTILEKRNNFPYRVGLSDRDYFKGLADAGVEGAEEVVELIEQHDEIELYRDC